MSFRQSINLSKYQEFDPETGELARKRSLVKPERSRIDQSHPRYHYSQVANQESSHLKILPSSTGLNPGSVSDNNHRLPSPSHRGSAYSRNTNNNNNANLPDLYEEGEEGIPLMEISSPTKNNKNREDGREVFGLNDEIDYSPNRNNVIKSTTKNASIPTSPAKRKAKGTSEKNSSLSSLDFWKIYCYIITFWAPGPLLRLFGIKSKEQQYAWREKMGLLSCILYLGAFSAYVIFGFTRTVCFHSKVFIRNNDVMSSFLIMNGRAFDLSHSQHPKAAGIGVGTNVLYPPINAGGMDASFLFQNVNGNCKGLIKARDNATIPHSDDNLDLAWYMPCNLFKQDGSTKPNFTEPYYSGWACHTSELARGQYYNLTVAADVYFTWDDIRNSTRNLVVYNGVVLDLDLIDWISSDQVTYPEMFTELKNDPVFKGHDISVALTNSHQRQVARCLTEIVKVGTIDSDTIGCIASTIVLVASLIFILGVVIVKFVMACYFRSYVSIKQGTNEMNSKSMLERDRQIDNWADDPTSRGPIHEVPVEQRANYHSGKTNRQSIFIRNIENNNNTRKLATSSNLPYTTMSSQAALLSKKKYGNSHKRVLSNHSLGNIVSSSNLPRNRLSQSSLDLLGNQRPNSVYNPFEDFAINGLSPDIIHPDVVPQPPVEYQPTGYPLLHTLVLVTCYSEDEVAIRTTMDSIATTDYPNSHKLIFVVCDGIIKGSGNDVSTPDVALSMMTDFTIPPDDVVACSYVAVAQGSKRHNMAKVYAGFYKYDDETVPPEKQQRVPVITVVKCGTPSEANLAKPGNRGKRDSQIILMSFLQKVMFDERMTEFEFEVFTSIWRITGLLAEFYEVNLMVDADTKVFPDSINHMCAEMVKDPMIMGLCGETKISNKRKSWVTAIQVFEYYISHHQSKAFESVFGGVTCLPGCFSMYRIKAPKGSDGYWVPILANPDIVERYSDNVVDTLHRKNLLLLGEDRFLSSLMLKTFPKRKQIFLPKAACKTIVPDSFLVLLSQRRRWINSTVHNLMELALVNDLCGTFCFSMQFVVIIELIGTLVLPMAICITIYVIVYAIVSTPTPVMSLVLLSVIFGLPGILIVVTVSSWSYFVYFLIYLLALPVWNLVLPSYAFWKFDDFSWGETRTVDGDVKGDHAAAEGLFDSSHITMKRWKEFERERRGKELNAENLGGLSYPRATWDPASEKEEEDFSNSGSSQ